MIRIGICDDNSESLTFLKNKINDFCRFSEREAEIYTCNSGQKIIELLCKRKEQFDVLFLDVDMPDKTGFDVAAAIRENNIEVILVFVSAYEKFVFESIKFTPFRYIRKGYLEEELPSAMTAVFRKIDSNRERNTFVKTQYGSYALKHSDIIYFRVNDHNVDIYLINEKVVSVRSSVKKFYEKINDERFIKIHSGCVVNVQYINGVEKDEVTLDNGKVLLASQRKMKDVKFAFMNYWRKQL